MATNEPHAKRRGWLKNGNPAGDPSTAARCGARPRKGSACKGPAMQNGRCRMHGGTSTGPRTAVGLACSTRANSQHFDEVDRKIGTGLWEGDLYIAAGYSFCDEKLRAELEDFYRQHQFEGKEREEKRMLERISDCIALRSQQQKKLSAWLQQNGDPTNALSSAGAKR